MTAGRERGIVFQGWGVRAIRKGRKTQTRRMIKSQPFSACTVPYLNRHRLWVWHQPDQPEDPNWPGIHCPYGRPGDLLVLKSTWATSKEYDRIKPSRLRRDARIWTLFDGESKPEWCGRSRPARFVPKWLYPRFPKAPLTEVRVQRVQEISEEDAKAEGTHSVANTGPDAYNSHAYRDGFAELWDSINGKRPGCSRDSNCWVWALTFEPPPAGGGALRGGPS